MRLKNIWVVLALALLLSACSNSHQSTGTPRSAYTRITTPSVTTPSTAPSSTAPSTSPSTTIPQSSLPHAIPAPIQPTIDKFLQAYESRMSASMATQSSWVTDSAPLYTSFLLGYLKQHPQITAGGWYLGHKLGLAVSYKITYANWQPVNSTTGIAYLLVTDTTMLNGHSTTVLWPTTGPQPGLQLGIAYVSGKFLISSFQN